MYLIIIAGWFFYFTIHSLLASNSVKKWCKQYLPGIFRYYRIYYNFIAVTGLILLLRITIQNDTLLFTTNDGSKIVSFILLLTGFIILSISFYTFDKMEFLGLKQSEEKTQGPLVTTGIYQYVRHPLYTGTFFIITGLFLLQPTSYNILFFFITIVYIEIGSRLEEKKLTEEFGSAYTDYCRKVKRYFPYLY